MIHEAYMPVYMGSRFSLRTGGQVRGFTRGSTRGPRGPKKTVTLTDSIKIWHTVVKYGTQ